MKVILIILLFSPLITNAQYDTISSYNKIISINEKGINQLTEKYHNILKNKGGIEGWRVQIQFKAKEAEILKLKIKFIRLYPNIPVHLKYEEPYYKIRVGNCRTKLEAIKLKNIISKDFPSAYPVPEIINFSELN